MNLIPQPAVADPQPIVLHGVGWKTYEKFLDAVGDRPLRLTYDGENLEIMAPLGRHEWIKGRIGFVLPFIAAELGVPIQRGGSTTFRREDVKRGLEPDECFYVGENAKKMTGLRDIDLRRDPPPDLAIEVDFRRHELDRAEIYAKLGVPELWLADETAIQPQCLQKDGTYANVNRSSWFPTVSMEGLLAFLMETQFENEIELIVLAQKWARDNVGQGKKRRPSKGKSRRRRKD